MSPPPMTRRSFLALAAASAGVGLAACTLDARGRPHFDLGGDPYATGRLTARPGPNATGDARTGVHRLGLAEHRDALLFVPTSYRPDRPAPLAVGLHGAGGRAKGGLHIWYREAEAAG